MGLGTAATVVTSVVTACVVLYISSGPLFAAVVLVASIIAFVAWARTPDSTDSNHPAVGPYLAAIVAVLLVGTARYWSGYPSHLAGVWPGLFTPHYFSADVTWFVATVTFPVSLMLAGGYALLRGHAIGRYMAWWAFAYVMADAVLQIAVEFGTPGYDHRYLVGALFAAIQMAIGATGWLRMAGRSTPKADRPYRPLSNGEKILWSLGFVTFVVIYGITLFGQAGYMPVTIIVGSMVGGLFAWLRTTARIPVDRLKIVPLYLLMVALFYIHVGEEALTGFNHGIAAITGTPWSDADFFGLIGLLGPVLWVAAALGMWLRKPWGDFLVWFLTVGMILGEPTHHIIFPVVAAVKLGVGYTYFSGMITALFPMIPAVILASAIFADTRAAISAKPRQRPVAAVAQLA
jgi:hypothetical protein